MKIVLSLVILNFVLPISRSEMFSAIAELENLVYDERKILMEIRNFKSKLSEIDSLLSR